MFKILFALVAMVGLLSNASAHEHHPPHQGTLIVLGEEFAHLELVVDPVKGSLSAYSLDGEAENAVPLVQESITINVAPKNGAQAFDVVLKAVENPLTGEKIGSTSQFDGESVNLKGLDKFSGLIEQVTTKGEVFKGIVFEFPGGNDHD